jgi:excisionase family DNA binding protein
MENTSILINSAEAAKLLNVSEKTLWNHTAPRGKCIPAVRLGKTVRYSRAALDSWVAAQSNWPGPHAVETLVR